MFLGASSRSKSAAKARSDILKHQHTVVGMVLVAGCKKKGSLLQAHTKGWKRLSIIPRSGKTLNTRGSRCAARRVFLLPPRRRRLLHRPLRRAAHGRVPACASGPGAGWGVGEAYGTGALPEGLSCIGVLFVGSVWIEIAYPLDPSSPYGRQADVPSSVC